MPFIRHTKNTQRTAPFTSAHKLSNKTVVPLFIKKNTAIRKKCLTLPLLFLAILERIEHAASSALERNIEHESTSSLFSADLENSYTGVEDDIPDVHENRWTDLGRPWSRSYSKFRRILKKLLRAQDVDEETVENWKVTKKSRIPHAHPCVFPHFLHICKNTALWAFKHMPLVVFCLLLIVRG